MRSFVVWLREQPRSHHLIALAAALLAAGGVALWWKAPALAPQKMHEGASSDAAAADGAQAPEEDTRSTKAGVADSSSANTEEGANQGAGSVAAASGAHPPVRRPIDAGVSPQLREQLEAAMAAVEAQPANPEAWLNLGVLRKAVGDLEGAKEAWRYANELRPAYVLPLVNIGSTLLLEEGNAQEAQRFFDLARERNPTYLFTYQQYADLFSGLRGEHGKAEAFLRAGIAENPESAALWYWLGEVLERAKGRGGDALFAFLRARDLARENKERAQEGSEPYRTAEAIERAADAGVKRLGGA